MDDRIPIRDAHEAWQDAELAYRDEVRKYVVVWRGDELPDRDQEILTDAALDQLAVLRSAAASAAEMYRQALKDG